MFLYHLKVTMWLISVKVSTKSNIVCEYEVNLSTNEKVITEKQHQLLENNVEYQGHLKVNVTMLQVVEKVLI